MHRRLIVAVISLLSAAPAFALDMPARKPGLWDLKMNIEGRNLPVTGMKHCVDQATDKLMNANFGGSANEACSKQDVTKTATGMIVDSVCKFGDATTTSHAVITGSLDSAYTVDVTSTRTGGPPLPGHAPGAATHMRIQANWLGACAAGQRPGDIIMANGMKMNILDMPKPGAVPKRPQ
jgi:Protein of unknown function (DUF3617)